MHSSADRYPVSLTSIRTLQPIIYADAWALTQIRYFCIDCRHKLAEGVQTQLYKVNAKVNAGHSAFIHGKFQRNKLRSSGPSTLGYYEAGLTPQGAAA
jgi:hypothetical protein